MGEPNTQPNTQQDIFNGLNPSSEKQELPSLPRTSSESLTMASTIPPAQKVASIPVSWSTQANKKSLQDYKKNRAEKYAQYFQGNRILPILELVEAVKPKTLSLIVTDIKTRILAGLKKEKFEELLKAVKIPARYFCRCSFATWDVLLLSQELATKLTGNSSITTKYYIGLGVRVFANGPGDMGSIPGRVIPKTQKMVLDASLLNTQHYKVRIKGKVEQSREAVAPSPTHWCSSYRKGSLRVTLDYGRQLYLLTARVHGLKMNKGHHVQNAYSTKWGRVGGIPQ